MAIKLVQESISIDDWIEIQDCPIQRDTEGHARKAKNKHLKNASQTQMRVSAARLPEGEVFKLDGHTRAFLWEEGSLDRVGELLFVDMYLVDDMTQVEDLYQQFDTGDAVETSKDKLFGAYRLNNFHPQSQLVRCGGVTSAISVCTNKRGSRGKLNIYKEVTPFIPALKIIDKYMLTSKLIPVGILSALILTVFKHGEAAMDFWAKYHNDEGIKQGRTRDGVQALTEKLTQYRQVGRIGGGAAAMIDLASCSLSAFQAYRQNKLYTGGLKKTDLLAYLEKIEILKAA